MATDLTLEELARHTGEQPEDLCRWCDLGLVGVADADGFAFGDVERARLVRLLVRRGIGLEAVAGAERDLGLLSRFLSDMYPGDDVPSLPLAEGVRRAGIDPALAREIWEAGGLSEKSGLLTDDDVGLLQRMAAAVDAGLPPDALIQMVKVYADTLGRVAEAEGRLFHVHVHERLAASGLTGSDLAVATARSSDQLRALVEPTILYFHRKATTLALRDHVATHLAQEAGLVARPDVTGQIEATVVFVDLARFTSLTEAMGDLSAATVLDRFSDLVRPVVNRYGGRIAKQIGDAFMFVFTDPGDAVACALDVNDATRAESRFLPTRTGIHHGALLYRDGDYVGSAVNMAARITTEASPNQVLASAYVASVTGDSGGVTFRPLGARHLRGIPEEVELCEVRREGATAPVRLVDPVCGMGLASDDIVARLRVEGQDHVFCSSRCLERYVAAPDRFP